MIWKTIILMLWIFVCICWRLNESSYFGVTEKTILALYLWRFNQEMELMKWLLTFLPLFPCPLASCIFYFKRSQQTFFLILGCRHVFRIFTNLLYMRQRGAESSSEEKLQGFSRSSVSLETVCLKMFWKCFQLDVDGGLSCVLPF